MAPGSRSASVSVSDNGPGTSQTVPLSGTGSLFSSATKINSSSNPSAFGQSVTFTATVTSQGAGTPTGTVTFSDGSTVLGTSPLTGGTATFSDAMLALGLHFINAVYSGDANFSGSSASLNQTVNQATTSTTLTSNLNPSGLDSPVTFTAVITSAVRWSSYGHSYLQRWGNDAG